MLRRFRPLALLLATFWLAGCGPSGPLKVSGIQTGKSLNSDGSVGTHTTRFGREDTMYVSVITAGDGRGTIVARWTYGGRQINEGRKEVAYRGRGVTEFHIEYPGGFPVGVYTVEIFVDGQSVGTRDLRVE